MLSIIVAIAKNNVIGKDNKLLWHIPEDLKRFKELTTGHTIIMGRKTFESLGKVLPNRKHVVLSQNTEINVDDENVIILRDVKLLKEYIESPEENFVIGGGKIYQMLLPYATKLYITKINEDFDGDIYFPIISENQWKEVKRQTGLKNQENPYDYEYIDYVRK